MLAAAVEAVIVHLSCAMKNVVLAGVVLVALLEATSFHVAAVGGCRAWGCPYGQHCVPDDRIGHCVPDDVKSRGPYKPFVPICNQADCNKKCGGRGTCSGGGATQRTCKCIG
ncbi:hypothetical protein AAVH_10306 [Aphelenchoides avenae]|nr:hypothetical protein AAVH_10306 [Aphelenchus avenae]